MRISLLQGGVTECIKRETGTVTGYIQPILLDFFLDRYGRRYALLDAKTPLRRRGIEFFWFDGKLGQKSEEKVLKDSMKPSQNSSASVSETWSRTESNRIFTRLLNGTISLQPYVKILLDYGEMMAALFFEMLMIHQRKSNRSYENKIIIGSDIV
ncbi:hypothetical protein IGI04_032342 [Brassica rapa subsp. trilocularis]|uniref:Uncharacterized protein n=1 Tax=Brassica rapa subsp. trilocularis TaxID=1813537 RepID=A0ABQ7M084_BRACM|nr:hypothetical protein IGI04_032342 [Brassica rapa subsp. trilocularis]